MAAPVELYADCGERLRMQFNSWVARQVAHIRTATERLERQAQKSAGAAAKPVAVLKDMQRWPAMLATLDRLSRPQRSSPVQSESVPSATTGAVFMEGRAAPQNPRAQLWWRGTTELGHTRDNETTEGRVGRGALRAGWKGEK